MIKTYKHKELGKGNYGWLKTSYHFSFANYYNPSKTRLGTLRVLNDDYIMPHNGFDTHPHNDMEIITYIVDGELTHQDSMGNKKTLGRHGVQYMSAGTGVFHSEHNQSDDILHLYQIWIFPDKKGHIPNYGDYDYSNELTFGKWNEIVSSFDQDAKVKIHQEASILVGEFQKGETVLVDPKEFDYTYLLWIEGSGKVNDLEVSKGDAIESDESYTITLEENAHMLLLCVNER